MTDRDYELLDLLVQHRVLTTEQIVDCFFTNSITARHRLTLLYELRLVDRFRPRLAVGSAQHHYVVDHAGWIVTHPGVDETKLKWSQSKARSIEHSQSLRHRVGVNRFFCLLKKAAREESGYELTEWWSERQCAKACGGFVYPDGWGGWQHPEGRIDFFIEYDRGTETLKRLSHKMSDYRRLSEVAGRRHLVLFVFESPGRELSSRPAIANRGVAFATMTLDANTSPHEAVWWQHSIIERLRLHQLTTALPE